MYLEHYSWIQKIAKDDRLFGEVISGEIPTPPGKTNDHDLSISAQLGGGDKPPLIWEFILNLIRSGISSPENFGNRRI